MLVVNQSVTVQDRQVSSFGLRTVLVLIPLIFSGVGCDLSAYMSPPDAPSELEAVSRDGAIELKWSPVQEGDLAGYNVYRSTSSIKNTSRLDPINGKGLAPETGYTDEAVNNGTTYHYVVTAVDEADNESNPSGEVQKTPFAKPPDRP